jgi:hypothetical protein
MWAATRDPHGLRFACRLWFLSFHLSLVIKLLATSPICLGGSVINGSGLYHRVWVGSALSNHGQSTYIYD